MNDEHCIKKCRICGAEYAQTRNPDYPANPYALRYINYDGQLKYLSNKPTSRCPRCKLDGRS